MTILISEECLFGAAVLFAIALLSLSVAVHALVEKIDSIKER